MDRFLRQAKLDELQVGSVLPLGRSTSTPTDVAARDTSSKGGMKVPTIGNVVSGIINSVKRPATSIFGRANPFETDFAVHQVVGEGGFGRIYKCKSNVDGRWYAVKLEQFWFKPQAYFNPSQVRDVMMNEALLLARLDHENVCRYYNTWVTGSLVPIDCVGKRADLSSIVHQDKKPAKMRCNATRRTSSSSDFASFVNAANRFVPARTTSSFDEDDPDETGEIDESVFDLQQDELRAQLISASLDELPAFSDLGFDIEEGDRIGDLCDSGMEPTEPTPGHVPRRRQSMDLGTNVGSLCTQIDVYIQMALYDGDTLQHWIDQRKSLDAAENLKIFSQIVAGLKYIHGEGLIHRDIKPANIFLTRDSCVKIGDFGLAKNTLQSSLHIPPSQYFLDDGSSENGLDESAMTTSTGVGTPLYSSPEQMNGQPYDASTDIFSLGILLCELFMPFATQMERLVVLSGLRKGAVPVGLQQGYPKIASLIERMVCADKKLRPTSADIERIALHGLLGSDPPTPIVSRTSASCSLSTRGLAMLPGNDFDSRSALTDLISTLYDLEQQHEAVLQQSVSSLETRGLQELSMIAQARKHILSKLESVIITFHS